MKFDPFLGVEASYDVLDPLITVCATVATGLAAPLVLAVLRTAREAARKRGIEVALDLSIECFIKGDLTFKREPGSKGPEVSGAIVGEVPIKVEGRVKGSLDLLIVKKSAALEAEASSGIDVEHSAGWDAQGIFLDSKLRFRGLTIRFSAWKSTESEIGEIPGPGPEVAVSTETEVSDRATLKVTAKKSATREKTLAEYELTLIKERPIFGDGDKPSRHYLFGKVPTRNVASIVEP